MPSTLRPKQQKETESKLSQMPSTLRQKYSETDFQSEEETEREIERSKARTLSRAGEAVLGAPGDIASFVSSLFGKEQSILPTSQTLRGLSEKATLGYTKSKTELEKTGDELISDIASMALPGSGHYSFFRNIGVPVVGNLVKEGLKYLDTDQEAQSYGKVGTMVALDLLSRSSGATRKFAGSLFQKAEEAIPKGLSIDATGLEKSLNNLEKELSKGGLRPTTKKALEKSAEIKNEIKNGKIDAKRLAAYRPSINEAIDELGGFQVEVPKKLKPATIRNLNEVKNEVIKTLDQYGEKFNPQFFQLHRSANEAWAAYQQSNKIANFIRDKVGFAPKSKAVAALFSYAPGPALAGLAALGPISATSGALGFGGYQAYKIFERVRNSPTLRKFYLNSLKEAAAGNVSATAKNLKGLDGLLKLQEDQERKEQENQEKKRQKT